MSDSWNDTRMGSGFEEVGVGYKDPRLHVMFQPAAASVLPAGRDAEWPYKGITGGSYIAGGKTPRQDFSKVSANFQQPNWNIKPLLHASEVNFALAEAKLRGWTGSQATKSAKEYYEDGVRRSWEFWQGFQNSGHRMIRNYDVEAYLNDDTSMPLAKIEDPFDSRNNYDSRMTDPRAYTIKWRDDVDKEFQLERIITQKWLAAWNNANEVWSDHRRTGYPKLNFNAKNDKNPNFGAVADNDFLKRMPFAQRDIDVNSSGVVEATKKLPAPSTDLITTPLWIHTPWVDHANPDNKLPN
jgi:hypothetical protein